MPLVAIDGISTRYEVVGSGPPLLMFSPGGFDATLEKWSSLGVYAKTRMFEQLSAHFSCIVFDRRETGQSGGRVERVTWGHYAAQGKGLLDHLGIRHAHVMGGCMGCCPGLAFAVTYPEATRGLVLFWPVGGPRYRISSHRRFSEHLAFVHQHGLAAVVSLVRQEGQPFGANPRGGPWASVIKHDEQFADAYATLPVDRYTMAVVGCGRTLFDRDTAPGAEPEDLMRLETRALIVPGHDASHATSAARYLEECLEHAEYWDTPVERQTEETVGPKLLAFLHES